MCDPLPLLIGSRFFFVEDEVDDDEDDVDEQIGAKKNVIPIALSKTIVSKHVLFTTRIKLFNNL